MYVYDAIKISNKNEMQRKELDKKTRNYRKWLKVIQYSMDKSKCPYISRSMFAREPEPEHSRNQFF